MGDEQLVETKFFVSLVLTYVLLFIAMILGGVTENFFPQKTNETLFSVMLINFVSQSILVLIINKIVTSILNARETEKESEEYPLMLPRNSVNGS
jgi:hypothetical protein